MRIYTVLAGKSTLAAFVTAYSPLSPSSVITCCLCSGLLGHATEDACSVLFRLICAKLLRLKPDVVPYVYNSFVCKKTTASLSSIREILLTLLARSGTTFLVIDGLDEYDSAYQVQIVEELSRLTKARLETGIEHIRAKLKLMICSRETKEMLRSMPRRFQRLSTINLSDESGKVNRDIVLYTAAQLEDLRIRFGHEEVDLVGQRIVAKAYCTCFIFYPLP